MKIPLSLLIVVLLFYGCQNDNGGFTIKGNISSGAGKSVYLERITTNSVEQIDSVEIDNNGMFELHGHTKVPDFYRLGVSKEDFIYLIADSLDKIIIDAKVPGLLTSCTIKGSEESNNIRDLNLHNYYNYQRIDSLGAIFRKYQGSGQFDSVKKQLDNAFIQIFADERTYLLQFLKEHERSLASLLALYQQLGPRAPIFRPDSDFAVFARTDSILFKNYPKSEQVLSLHSQVLETKTYMNAMRSSYAPASGSTAPDINEKSPDGTSVSLSSLRGKYVLLDFWASWCKPCREENPNLVKAYQKYHEKGFEIYQVSLDQDRSAWINAIKQDNLTWIHVSDLKFWDSAPARLYNIQSIPASFLLDKNGVIIAMNPRGKELEQTLKTLLK